MVSEGTIRVVVDKSRCIGSGGCLYAEPAVFDQDEDDGIVILLEPHPGPEHHDNVQLAVHTCPGQAIRVVIGDEDDEPATEAG